MIKHAAARPSKTSKEDASPHLYGYARVSTTDQDLSIQEASLRAAGCTLLRTEKRTGTSRNGRYDLETLMAFLRSGDSLVV
jgi:DNA invertase Pin-like site-specific DNA recombinase